MKETGDGIAIDESGFPQTSSGAGDENGAATLVRRQTGPRTSAGKQRSKYNATKHGIFSSVVVLETESRGDFESLLGGLQKSFRPVGELEDILVEKLAMILWRHRRLVVAEGAEIRKGRDFFEWDRNQEDRLKAEKLAQIGTDEYLNPKVGLIWHINNPEILNRCLELLGELQKEIEKKGLWKAKVAAQHWTLTMIYGPHNQDNLEDTFFTTYVSRCRTAEFSEEERIQRGYASPDVCKENILQAVAAEIERLKQYKKEQLKIEARRMDVEILRQGVPDSSSVDRLLRYEASLKRAFDRTLTQLERLQRMRLGQAVPPPVKVEVSKS